jgi:hypothetical protein
MLVNLKGKSMKLRIHVLLFAIVAVTMLGLGCQAQLTSTPSMNSSDQTTTLPASPDSSGSETRNFEGTAIAVFTQNPTLALSSTPGFAQIIYDDLVRQQTETPNSFRNSPSTFAARATDSSSTANSTQHDASAFPQTSTYKCYPVIETRELPEKADEIKSILRQQNIEVSVTVISIGVSGLDENCEVPFEPVFTRFQFGVTAESVADESSLAELVSKIIATAIDNQQPNDQTTMLNGAINIFFDANDGHVRLDTDLPSAVAFYRQRLTGFDLLEALGGFVESEAEAQ